MAKDSLPIVPGGKRVSPDESSGGVRQRRKKRAKAKIGPRFRMRSVPTKDTDVGRDVFISSSGRTEFKYVRPKSYTQSSVRLGERCWDEVHQREYTLYTWDRVLLKPGSPAIPPHQENVFTSDRAGNTVIKKIWLPGKPGRKPYYLNPHGYMRPVRSSRVWNTGGPFYKVKATNPWYQVQGIGSYRKVVGGFTYGYDGGFVPLSFGSNQMGSVDLEVKGLQDSTRTTGLPFGADGWAKARPKISSANMAQAIYEAKDGIQMLRTTLDFFNQKWKALGGHPTRWGPKKVADQFLNYAFGWKPFVNDLVDLFKTRDQYEKRIMQLMRDNGKYVRRRRAVRDKRDPTPVESFDIPQVWPTMYTQLYNYNSRGKFGYTNCYAEQIDNIWFEGCFSYYIPAFDQKLYDNADNTLQQLYAISQWARVNGFMISPSLLWKITPWTWLADWFGNAGHIIDNINASAEDNVHAKYAYIMRTVEKRVINDTTLFTCNGDVHMFWQQKYVTKSRDAASPYGFNVTWDDMTPMQLAILAALGITRL